jgi:hypothetical protein
MIVGELIGWRIWRIKRGYLISFSLETAWPPDEPMTGKPNDYNNAGIWAFKDKARALNKFASDTGRSQSWAFGSVRLWGEVIEHDLGWRAEFARVASIDGVLNGGLLGRKLWSLRERYKVAA